MKIILDPNSVSDYARFLKAKTLPKYRVVGRTVEFPDEYAGDMGMDAMMRAAADYSPKAGLFDYQADLSAYAIKKKKFAIFAECGLGKTFMIGECCRHAAASIESDKAVLIVSPLMVINQTIGEFESFYNGELKVERITAAGLPEWLESGKGKIGIVNYDAMRDGLKRGRLGAMILDESSMLKSHYGKWGSVIKKLGRGLEYKYAFTGTPAPNDRIEYANHAVFLDAFPTVNSFLAKYFVNRGQTDNRWELKAYALKQFYIDLSHWCFFLTNPATYGWKDNTESIPPIHVHVHDIPITKQQQELVYEKTGRLIADQAGGITSRSVLSQIAKGSYKGKLIESNKPQYIRKMVESWPDESTIIWCHYNAEQDIIASQFPDAANISGDTPQSKREEFVAKFKRGEIKTLISKPKLLGFGLNLQIATRQVFSGLQDSYEEFHQAVKRSNRIGSTRPLNVHIPVTEIEKPMIETVLDKAHRVQKDTDEQERIFKEYGHAIKR